jgi:23S rRNA pseudouridine2457 synthase
MARHFVIHKPFGYLSQFVNNDGKKNKLLGELGDFPKETMAIGRLDLKSEGLLLLTTDGKTSELVRGKKYEKEYWVMVDGLITDAALQKLQNGVVIGFDGKKYQTLPCKVKKLEMPNVPLLTFKIRDERHGPTSWISITICEGKFKQVRKMTAAVGLPTLRLIRIRIGNIYLGELKAGDWHEVKSLEQSSVSTL